MAEKPPVVTKTEEGSIADKNQISSSAALKGREENNRPYDPLDDEGFNAIGPR